MKMELSHFLGRKRYQRCQEKTNHRNGSYGRRYTLKGIGQVGVRVPRDRKDEYKTAVIPRSRQHEDQIRQDLCVMFLTGLSTRTLSLLSERLIGRKISSTQASRAGKELSQAVEAWRQRDLSGESFKSICLSMGLRFP